MNIVHSNENGKFYTTKIYVIFISTAIYNSITKLNNIFINLVITSYNMHVDILYLLQYARKQYLEYDCMLHW